LRRFSPNCLNQFALINEGDDNHERCVEILPSLSAPLVTTWACFTEAMYLLGRYGGWLAQQELLGLCS
jgi:hypothetical protein